MTTNLFYRVQFKLYYSLNLRRSLLFSLDNPSYYGAWQAWGACSATCGLGTQTRTRTCITTGTTAADCSSLSESATETKVSLGLLDILFYAFNVNFMTGFYMKFQCIISF